MSEPVPTSLRARLFVVLAFACSVASMAAAVRWYYLRQSAQLETAVSRELTAIGEGKLHQIDRWRRERLGDGRVLAASPLIDEARRILTHAATPSGSGIPKTAAALKTEFGYQDVILADRNGSVFFRLEDKPNGQSDLRQDQRRSLAEEALRSNDIVFSGINQQTRSSASVMTLTVPVAPLGVLILEIDPATYILPVMKSWPGASRTGETLLIAREADEAVYLSDLRYQPAVGIQSNGKPFTRLLKDMRIPSGPELDAGVMVHNLDYRRVEVFGYAKRVPGSNWHVYAKMDAAEVREPIVLLGRQMGLIMGLILLANGAGAGWLWKASQLRRQRQSEAMFRAVADETPALLWIHSPGEQDLFLNKSLRNFLGLRSAHLKYHWTTYIHPGDVDRAQSRLESCFRDRVPYSDEIRLRRADGQFRWTASQGLPRISASGEFLGYAGALLDITDLAEAQQKVALANASLEASLVEKTRQEAEIRQLTTRLIGAQEEERKRLSRELHDDLTQEIAALSISVGRLRMGLPPVQAESRSQTQSIQNKLIDLSESVRRISHDLHPAILQHSGLPDALRAYSAELSRTGPMRVTVTTAGDCSDIAPSISLNLYRIAQEALRNASRHSQAELAEVELTRENGSLRLRVRDHGIGMANSQSAGSGLGLVSIRERANLLRGTLTVDSSPGHGATVTITIDGDQSAPSAS